MLLEEEADLEEGEGGREGSNTHRPMRVLLPPPPSFPPSLPLPKNQESETPFHQHKHSHQHPQRPSCLLPSPSLPPSLLPRQAPQASFQPFACRRKLVCVKMGTGGEEGGREGGREGLKEGEVPEEGAKEGEEGEEGQAG